MTFDPFDLAFWTNTFPGVGGFLFALWAYWDTKVTKRVEFAGYRKVLLGAEALKLGDNVFTINGNVIDSLYREYIVVVCSGSSTVKFSDVINNISLSVKSGQIVAAGVLKSDDPDNGAAVDFDASKAQMTFDYLRSGDSILFYVDCTTVCEDHVSLSVSERERNVVYRSVIEKIDNKNRIRKFIYDNREAFVVLLFLLIFMSLAPVPRAPSDGWEALSAFGYVFIAFIGAPLLYLLSAIFFLRFDGGEVNKSALSHARRLFKMKD